MGGGRRTGVTVVEVMTVFVIAGVAAGLAAGRMGTNVRRARLRSALDLVANTVSVARTVPTARSCRTVVHLAAEPPATVWVTSCKRSGDGVDTVAVRRVSSYSGV